MEQTCATCGRRPRDGTAATVDVTTRLALTWSRQVGREGVEEWLCPECTRAHVRGIEARLEPEWW